MNELFGNTLGLKPSEIDHLRRTFRRRVPDDEIITLELARHLTEFSASTNRQVGVLLNRKGDVEDVVVGNAHRLDLPDIGRARAGQVRLRGLRLVHTHLRSEPLTRDDFTDLALLRLDCIAAVGVGTRGVPTVLHLAHLLPGNELGKLWSSETYNALSEAPNFGELIRALEAELSATAPAQRSVSSAERAVLLGVCFDGRRQAAHASLGELVELANTAGVEVVDTLLQVRPKPDPKYLIGRGKLEDINLRAMQQAASLLVVDSDLSPGQARHIGEATSLKVIDRTQLILDIFAQRAQSSDGKLQVELAQLQYMLPRLVRSDPSLSRLAGGIGGRGPGETRLEMDRRRVRQRIAFLTRRIEDLSDGRRVRRRRRERSDVPVISIVGYTNAGKSSLLNALTGAKVLVEDKLFATLDPTSRRLRIPPDRDVIICDTVGFIRELPTNLAHAFRATLEELGDASLLIHVADASDLEAMNQIAAVEEILESIGLGEIQRLLVWNKVDLVTPLHQALLLKAHAGIAISVNERRGLDALLSAASAALEAEKAAPRQVTDAPH